MHKFELTPEEKILREFEAIREEVGEAKTLSVLNESLIDLTVSANRIFDMVVSIVMEINFSDMPNPIKAQRGQFAEHLIEQLQLTLSLNNTIMKEALQNRIDIEITEMQKRQEAQKIRRAIGFLRDQSSDSFHTERQKPQPLGFKLGDYRKEIEETVTPVKMGFQLERSLTENTIKDIVEYKEDIEEATYYSIGFNSTKTGTQRGPINKRPIGFISPKKASEQILAEKVHQIIFNTKVGLFDFIRGDF